jgi:LysM repeat protein
MAINFKEETARVEYVIGEDIVRESISDEIVLPDDEADIERVLEVTAEVSDVEASIEEGGVDIDGEVDIGILYVADLVDPYEPQQPVYFFDGVATFNNFVDIPGAEAGMHVITDVRVIRVTSNVVDEQTVEVTLTLRKFVKVVEFRQITVVTEVTGLKEGIVEEELLRLNDVIGENTIQSIVEGELDVPPEKPPIERILRVQAELADDPEVELTEDAVIVDGTIEAGIVYVAATDEGSQPVHFVEGTFDFSKVVEVPGAMDTEDITAFVDVMVKRVSGDRVDDVTAEAEVVLEIFAKVTEPIQVTVVTDIESEQVEVDKELLRVEEVIGENTIAETITDNINIPTEKPDVEQVLEVNATIMDVATMVEEGGVTVEGDLEGTALYVADIEDPDAPQQPVHFVEDLLDFDNFVQITGVEEGMNAYANVSVQKVRYSLLNQRTIELIVALRKFVKVVQFRQLDIVTDIVVVSPVVDEECPPSYVVYVVQPGDTLYKIARRYNTTVDAIVEANDIVNPDRIDVGQKLCIPKGIIDAKG